MSQDSIYLQPSEYETYGLPTTVTVAMVRQAGALIDAFLTRQGGLVWSPDASGAPAYMAALQATTDLTSASGILVGANIVVPYTGGRILDGNDIGEVIILDRTDATKVEACVITNVTPAPSPTMTLAATQFAHSTGCHIEFGMTLCEQKSMPGGRAVTRLSEHPIQTVLSGAGRFGYGRRSQQMAGYYPEFNLLATVDIFGGPPLWTAWPPASSSYNRMTGEIWIPAGIYLAYYNEVKIWYTAGYSQTSLPWQIRQACANIVNLIKETGLGANIRRREATSGIASSKFENNMIDANTREMLTPYAARNQI